jgi:16S rRNA (uracil1498-N3)-methyltransferase
LAAETPSFVYVPDLGPAGSSVALSPDEAHYVTRVCRARVGDLVTATDGRGTLGRVRVVALGREVRGEVEAADQAERRRAASVWCGAPEGERVDWLIEKLAELGVQSFQPLDCGRAAWRRAAGRVARWHRLAVAALRQSRGRFLMEVREPAPLGVALAALPRDASCWLADPVGGEAPAASAAPGLTVGAIGPAAGFEEAEAASLKASGFTPIRLAEGRLRAETAALAWAAWWARVGH